MKKKILLMICICIGFLTYCHFRTVSLSDALNEKVISLLKKEHQTNGIDFVAVSYNLLDKKTRKDEIVLYGKFCILSYDIDKSHEYPDSGYHDFMVLYIHKDGNSYTLKEIWTPTDDDYLSSLLKKFPFITWSKVLLDDKYSNTLYEDCQNQFLKYSAIQH